MHTVIFYTWHEKQDERFIYCILRENKESGCEEKKLLNRLLMCWSCSNLSNHLLLLDFLFHCLCFFDVFSSLGLSSPLLFSPVPLPNDSQSSQREALMAASPLSLYLDLIKDHYNLSAQWRPGCDGVGGKSKGERAGAEREGKGAGLECASFIYKVPPPHTHTPPTPTPFCSITRSLKF